MLTKQLIVVEDDEALCLLYDLWLQPYGYSLLSFKSAEALLTVWPMQEAPNLLLVDRGLPGMSGLELIRHLKKDDSLAGIPVIFCSGYDHKDDIAEALYAGADDYLVKPIEKTLLLARLTAVTRRYNHAAPAESPMLLEHSNILALGEVHIQLSERECLIYRKLSAANGAIVSRTELSDRVLGLDSNIDSQPTIDLTISRLRKKLKKIRPNKDVIITHYGKGYSLLIEKPGIRSN